MDLSCYFLKENLKTKDNPSEENGRLDIMYRENGSYFKIKYNTKDDTLSIKSEFKEQSSLQGLKIYLE